MTQLILGGREHVIAEPVFKKLRKIIAAFNSLSVESSDADKISALEILLDNLTDGAVNLKQLKTNELDALLQAIPAICHLKTAPAQPGTTAHDSWGDTYAHLSACCGWTYDYIDNHMTLSRLEEYQAYWQKYPPTHQLAAAYLGYEPQSKQANNNFLATIAAQVKAAQK